MESDTFYGDVMVKLVLKISFITKEAVSAQIYEFLSCFYSGHCLLLQFRKRFVHMAARSHRQL